MLAVGKQVSENTKFTVCQDHFDMVKDIRAYREHDGRPVLNKDVAPHLKMNDDRGNISASLGGNNTQRPLKTPQSVLRRDEKSCHQNDTPLKAADVVEGYNENAIRSSNIAMSYKYCFVKSCNSNSKRNSDKYFFRVPYNKDIRRKWCEAVGRHPEGLSYTSAAFCCSDHFDVEADLNRIATSSSSMPILKKDVLPSLKVRNNQKLIVKDNDVHGIRGDDAPKNLFVREVVYIEENDNDRFLEETNEDTLNIEPDRNGSDPMAEDVIEILDDDKCVEHTSSTNETTRPQNKIVLHKSKNQEPTQNAAPLKDVPNKPLILRHITQLNSVGTQNAVKFISVPTEKTATTTQKAMKINSNETKIKLLPKATVLPANSIRAPSKFVAVDAATSKSYTVNKWKYLNVNEKARNAQKIDLQSDDDSDDCIVVEEQNELRCRKETETSTTHSTRKILTTLPSSISVKYTGNGRATLAPPPTQTPNKNLKQAPVKHQPNTCSALVPVQAKLGVREFGKINDAPNINEHKVFSLIKLMISENQLLLARNKGNLVKIARTKPNEFRIVDNIYYYRTNDEFANNYFFMNITRQSCNIKEIILRSYGIYWGNPRRSCVGVVETKGILDEETKDFVFQQVKKSLFQQNGRQNVSSSERELILDPPVQHNLITPNQARNKTIGVKPMKMPANRAGDDGTEIDPVIIKSIDEKKLSVQPSTPVQRRYTKKIAFQSPIVESTATSEAALDAFQMRSTIEKLSSPVTSTANIKRLSSSAKWIVTTKTVSPPIPIPIKRTATVKRLSSAVKEPAITKKISSTIQRTATPKTSPSKAKNPTKLCLALDVAKANNELIRLSQFLTPSIRNIINKLKYFELNGKVYSVNVGDSVTKEKPFHIVFLENKPEHLAELNVQPVSTLLYVSKLVSYLFQAIYPYLNNGRRKAVPILTPQDIITNTTPEEMETLIIDENERTYNEIATLEASVDNSHTAQSPSDFKHKCLICSQAFSRKYQLQRHQFVTHDSESANISTESTTSSNANILNKIPDTIRKAFQDKRTESHVKDLPLTTTIKTEKPEETIVTDRSLLVPLYEELINEVRHQGVPLVKFKEEPEEHFEEVTELQLSTDISTGEPKRYTKKRKLQQANPSSSDETDSAPESVKTKKIKASSRKRTTTLKKKLTFKQQRREKLKRLEKVRNSASKRKYVRSHTIDSQEMVPVIPIKISKANELIKQWPSLKVKLVDIKNG